MKKQFFTGLVLCSSLTLVGCSINIGGNSDDEKSSNNDQKSESTSKQSHNDTSNDQSSNNESGIKNESNITEQQSIAMAMLEPNLESKIVTGDELLSGKYTQTFGAGEKQEQDIDTLELSESPQLNKMKNKPEGMKFYGLNASKGSYATIVGVNNNEVVYIMTQSVINDYNDIKNSETTKILNISDLYSKYKDNRKVANVANKIEFVDPMPSNDDEDSNSEDDTDSDSSSEEVTRDNVIDKVESYEGETLDTDTYTFKEPEKTDEGKWGFSFEDKDGNLAGSYVIDDDGEVTEYDEDGEEVGSGY
ncbi:hypothetical protein [Mammaliicoccus vitulinus]|uniref:hypothetical protein n=1 Tax=Mammaliicoccus vitulinus TaxID=71237 RepID=UPI003BA393E4